MSGNDNKKNELDRSAVLSSRARNRTVMLSPEVTGQVRSLIDNKGDTENLEDREVTANHGFLAPVNFKKVVEPMEDVLKINNDTRNRTEQIDSRPKESLRGIGADAIGFGGSKSDVAVYDRAVPASVKDILNTKERRRGMPTSSDSSTLSHQAQTSFDAERENLTKSRKGFKKSRILGFLISFDKEEFGEIVEIREGRSIISSKYVDQADMLFIDDDSLSNPHAVIKADKQGRILLLDQLSEAGTSVIRPGLDEEIDAVGTLVELIQGDIIRMGARYFIFCAVPKIAIQD